MREEGYLKIFSMILGGIVFIFSIGLWVNNIDSNQAYAAAEIRSLQNEDERMRAALQEINQRLSRIEGKLDVTLRRVR